MVSWYHRPLEVGSSGPDVDLVRRKLNAPRDGEYDSDLAARVRGVQRSHGLPATGVVDLDTADVIGEPARRGLMPEWYRRPLGPGCHGDDVERLHEMLGMEPSASYSPELEAAIRRLQSQLWMIPTGIVDEVVAVAIGDDVPVSRQEV